MQSQQLVKILIVDDSQEKIDGVKDVWKSCEGAAWSQVESCGSIAAGASLLKKNIYDLLILDLNIPRRDRGTPDVNESKRFLEDVHEDGGFLSPRDVIILTAYEDLRESQKEFYESKGWTVLLYGGDITSWREILASKLSYLKKCAEEALGYGANEYRYDYCVIAALKSPELDAFLRCDYGWKKAEVLDSTEFRIGEVATKHGSRSIVCASGFRMGMVHAGLLTFKAWHHFRPRCIIMIGIAAGVKGACNLGDVLIAEETWDYNAGKVGLDDSGSSTFLPDPRHVNASHSMVESLWSFGQEATVVRGIEDAWQGLPPETRLAVKRGPVASGSAVVADPSVVKGIIDGNRKLLGLEMESYGFYAACEYLPRPRPKYICIKSVCDFADEKKGDAYQPYAAYTSAAFASFAIEAGIIEGC